MRKLDDKKRETQISASLSTQSVVVFVFIIISIAIVDVDVDDGDAARIGTQSNKRDNNAMVQLLLFKQGVSKERNTKQRFVEMKKKTKQF